MAWYRIAENALDAIANAINAKTGGSSAMTPAQMVTAIQNLELKKEIAWNQCPYLVRSYLMAASYDPDDYSESIIDRYAPSVGDVANSRPVAVVVDDVSYRNQVPNKLTPFATEETAGTLEPLNFLRWIYCPTANNVRDLGGWTCDGGTVRYGLLIRGGEPTAQDADVLVKECGVRFEMNLRGRAEANREYSVLGHIGYSVYNDYAWYSISNTTLWTQMLQTVFDCINNSIPIYFHCSAGADRTATLACILEGLLGMSQNYIDQDYELTCFYTGTGSDANARRRNESEWRGLINQINALSGNSFRDKVITFVLSLGFTVADINNFRAVMIDGNPEIITEPEISYQWNDGMNCPYSVGGDINNVTSNASYCITGIIPVEYGKTYTITIDGTTKLYSFRFVGADSNGTITESTSISDLTESSAVYTPSQNTTQMRLRGYSGKINTQNIKITAQ